MKIIVEKETGDILYAGNYLELTSEGVKSKSFIAPNITPDKYNIFDGVELNKVFHGRFFKYENGEVILKPEKEREYKNIVDPVPQRISKRRAVLVLYDKGLYNKMLDLLQLPENERALLEWETSSEVWRTKHFVNALAPGLGLSQDDLDDLFREAKGSEYD